MDEILFRALAEGVGRYLDDVDRFACDQPRPNGAELRRMVAAWRALLRLHRPAGPRGRCTACDKRAVMCTVWRVAAAYFVRRLRR